LKCATCCFITANLEIEDEKIKEVYSEKYFKGEEYEDYVRDKKIFQENFGQRIKTLEKFIPAHKLKRILEIGCAYGFFGELAKKRWRCSYLGIDIAEDAVNYAANILKLDAIRSDYLDIDNTQLEFDTCIMLDVIEHLPDPGTIVNKISKEISKGGYLVITTGDIGSLLAKIQGRRWRMIHPPSHLHYFSTKSIKKLLDLNGFAIEIISYPIIKRSLKQIFFSLFILNKMSNSAMVKRLYEIIPEQWYIPLNSFDIMLIIARKV
jgi:2-polyprenyl-3-methyl-5-hydroxy-6-metoxy-1,4-benzoquinol methylase